MRRIRIKFTVWRLVSTFVFQFESIVEIFSYYNIEFRLYIFIPEQFTVKAHPASFEGRGEGGAKNEGLLFQSTIF